MPNSTTGTSGTWTWTINTWATYYRTTTGTEGGDTVPNTTTTQTTVSEAERTLVNEMCQYLLNDTTMTWDARLYAAAIAAGETSPLGMMDFIVSIGLRHLFSLRATEPEQAVREQLERANFAANNLGRIAVTAGYTPPVTCPRCAQSINVGVTCYDCSTMIRSERQQREAERLRAAQERVLRRNRRFNVPVEDDLPFDDDDDDYDEDEDRY